jgi:translation initiation factor 1
MNDICPRCGLNKEICVCEEIAKEEQQVKVTLIKRKFGKLITVIEGINEKDVNTKDLAKKLKAKFACGGTAKDKKIELQGNHINKVKKELIELGFNPDSIRTK